MSLSNDSFIIIIHIDTSKFYIYISLYYIDFGKFLSRKNFGKTIFI